MTQAHPANSGRTDAARANAPRQHGPAADRATRAAGSFSHWREQQKVPGTNTQHATAWLSMILKGASRVTPLHAPRCVELTGKVARANQQHSS